MYRLKNLLQVRREKAIGSTEKITLKCKRFITENDWQFFKRPHLTSILSEEMKYLTNPATTTGVCSTLPASQNP
jgi:hypothetical protein